MPFINESSKRETMQRFMPYEHVPESSWSETFAASLGQVVDEELSTSAMLNREGFETRNRLIDERIKAGEIDPSPFKTRGGRARLIDYGKIAERLQDPDIKTDSQLNEERNALLAQRREYAQNVLSTGSGLAQFAGAATAYVLDPINIATMGISGPVAGAKAATVIGRALQYGRNAAIISGGTEIGIQALVYGHKQAIDSPYDAGDALANIGMAATGALVLGSIQGGVSSWIDAVLKKADEVKQAKDVLAAKEYLTRMKRSLENAPKAADADLVTPPPGADMVRYYHGGNPGDAAGSLHFTSDLNNAKGWQSRNPDMQLWYVDVPKDSPIRGGDPEFGVLPPQNIELPADIANTRKEFIDGETIGKRQIKSDLDHLEEGVKRSEAYAKPTKAPEHYPVPERPKAAGQTVSDRERDLLTRQGITEDYDADMQAFRQIENPLILDGEDMINAKTVIDEIDKELSGLDSVLRCSYG